MEGQRNASDHFEDEKIEIKQMRADFKSQFREVSKTTFNTVGFLY